MKKINNKSVKNILSVVIALMLVSAIGVSAFAASPSDSKTPRTSESSGMPSENPDSATGNGMQDFGGGYGRPDGNGMQGGYGMGGCFDDMYGNYGYGYGYGYDMFGDFDDYGYDFFYGYGDEEDFDIDEFLADVEDEDLKKEIKELYEAYLEAYDKYVEADDALYEAEDALYAAIEKIEYKDDDKSANDEKGDAKADPKNGNGKDAKDAGEGEPKESFEDFDTDSEEFQAMFNEFLKWYNAKSV